MSVNDLTLQVGLVYVVKIADHQMTDSGSCEIHRHRRTQSAGPDNQHPGVQQPLLPRLSNFEQAGLAGVTIQLGLIHVLIVFVAYRDGK